MNINRTKTIELTTIPAIAFKLKLTTGGAGIRIMRLDTDAEAVATLDKRTGEAQPYGPVDAALFPMEAFDEAIELTSGLPYAVRRQIKIDVSRHGGDTVPAAGSEADGAEASTVDMVDSDEYAALIDRYSDERGKLNYTLMNKDFIQFASRSKTVAELVSKQAPSEAILLFVVKSRAALVANKKDSLDDRGAAALIDTLNEIDPRSAFKELTNHINKLLARAKR